MIPILLAAGTDVTPDASVVAALPHWLQITLMVLGAVVPVASFVADFLDRYAKTLRARGQKIPAWLVAFGAAAHGAALNSRKSAKLAKEVVAKEPRE